MNECYVMLCYAMLCYAMLCYAMWLSACGHLGWESWLPAPEQALEAGREHLTPTISELWESQGLSTLCHELLALHLCCLAYTVAFTVCVSTFHHQQVEASLTHLALAFPSGWWSPFHVCLFHVCHSELYFLHPLSCFVNLRRTFFILFSTLDFSPIPQFYLNISKLLLQSLFWLYSFTPGSNWIPWWRFYCIV